MLNLHQKFHVLQDTLQLSNLRSSSGQRSSTDIPDVFIYRRTKKTGSSSMLGALLKVTDKLGYIPLYYDPPYMKTYVRAEGLRPIPRRLFVAQHNAVTREHTQGRKTVIADTIIDGYRQVTSFCRFTRNISDCAAGMKECLNDAALSQRFYRWAGKPREDEETFIDLPLSSAHPALSSSVLRRIFPNITLDVHRYNVAGSSCDEKPDLRKIYNNHYKILDYQIDALRKRLLHMAGYPTAAAQETLHASLVELMDAAEEEERKKYTFSTYESTRKVASDHSLLMKYAKSPWRREKNGKLVLEKRSE